MNENNKTNISNYNTVIGDENGPKDPDIIIDQNHATKHNLNIENKRGIGKTQKILTLGMVSLGFLLGMTLLMLRLSSPTGNVGDEGIIALPLLFMLVIITPIAFVISLIHLIAKRPSGNSLLFTFLGIVFPLIMIGCVFGYGNLQHRQGLISDEEAIALARQCKVEKVGGGVNHNRRELILKEQSDKKVYISTDNYMRVSGEIKKLNAQCN